jgi:hypothetical protein
MRGTSGTNERKIHTRFWWRHVKEPLRRFGRRLKYDIKGKNGRAWTGFIWLRREKEH